jgi:hypothetical protein
MVIKGHKMTPVLLKCGEGKPRVPYTIGDKELQAKRLHFETCLLQQDLLRKTEEIHTVISSDDERAKKKIPKATSELLSVLRIIGERLEDLSRLMQKSRECKDYIQSKRSKTNAEIKVAQRNVPVEKRKSPEDVRLGQNPGCEWQLGLYKKEHLG